MKISSVRQLSDGEELVLEVEEPASRLEADPRNPSFEHRSEALSDQRLSGDSPRGSRPSQSSSVSRGR